MCLNDSKMEIPISSCFIPAFIRSTRVLDLPLWTARIESLLSTMHATDVYVVKPVGWLRRSGGCATVRL